MVRLNCREVEPARPHLYLADERFGVWRRGAQSRFLGQPARNSILQNALSAEESVLYTPQKAPEQPPSGGQQVALNLCCLCEPPSPSASRSVELTHISSGALKACSGARFQESVFVTRHVC